jgi:abortive infection bacteriophage resistance protein
MKQATTIREQITLLKSRGVKIASISKAEEQLGDIGYYRLGFYLFPFEETFPVLKKRTHKMIPKTTLDDAVALYYFDYDIRPLLMRYANRIEIALRTYMVLTLSNKYKADPIWFVNKSVVRKEFADSFEEKCYNDIKKNPVISRHHAKYKTDIYAPAWKTLEYMMFGNIQTLYTNLISVDDKRDISIRFGVNKTTIFENYLEIVRSLRNVCAHGGVVYDLKMPRGIKDGPAGKFGSNRQKLKGAYLVLKYLLSHVSTNRAKELDREVKRLLKEICSKSANLKSAILATTGFEEADFS